MSGIVKTDTIQPQTSGAGIALTGITSGTSAAAGNAGETIESVVTSEFSSASPTVSTFVDATSGSISLTAGNWVITAFGCLMHAQTASSTNIAVPILAIRDGANTVIESANGAMTTTNGTVTIDGTFTPVTLTYRVSISGTTTYKLSLKYENFNGTASVSSLRLRVANTIYPNHYYIRAIRQVQ